MKTFRIAGALLFAALAIPAAAQDNAKISAGDGDIATRGLKVSDFPRQKMLAPNVYLHEGLHAPDPDGNIFNTVSMFVVTTDGVVVVDAQGDPAQTQSEIDAIKKITPQPVKYVVVASDHGDHVGGNAAFKTAFPSVIFISSPASQKVLAKSDTPPTETVSDKRTISLGGADIQILNFGRAHTGGDLVVYLPQTKVLFMSEVYLRGVFPPMRTAYPSEWVKTIAAAEALPNVTWYIPGHGFSDDAASMKRDLEVSRKALVAVIAEAKRLHDAHVPCEKPDQCEAAREANWGPYAELGMTKFQAPVAILRIYQELDGKLP